MSISLFIKKILYNKVIKLMKYSFLNIAQVEKYIIKKNIEKYLLDNHILLLDYK